MICFVEVLHEKPDKYESFVLTVQKMEILFVMAIEFIMKKYITLFKRFDFQGYEVEILSRPSIEKL